MHAGIFLGIHVASTWLGNALTLEKSESVHRSSGNNRRKNRAKLSGQFLSPLGRLGMANLVAKLLPLIREPARNGSLDLQLSRPIFW